MRRFAPHGDAFVFRAKPGAPGYLFTAAECERLRSAYVRQSSWVTGGGVVLIVAGVVLDAVLTSQGLRGGIIGVVMLVEMLFLWSCSYYLWNAPVRALNGRPALADAPEAEDEAVYLSWGRLGFMLAGSVVFAVMALLFSGNMLGLGLAFAVGAVNGLLVTAYFGVRKFRARRPRPSRPDR